MYAMKRTSYAYYWTPQQSHCSNMQWWSTKAYQAVQWFSTFWPFYSKRPPTCHHWTFGNFTHFSLLFSKLINIFHFQNHNNIQSENIDHEKSFVLCHVLLSIYAKIEQNQCKMCFWDFAPHPRASRPCGTVTLQWNGCKTKVNINFETVFWSETRIHQLQLKFHFILQAFFASARRSCPAMSTLKFSNSYAICSSLYFMLLYLWPFTFFFKEIRFKTIKKRSNVLSSNKNGNPFLFLSLFK